MVIKSLRELAESGGSSLATIEKYMRQSFSGAADINNLTKLIRLAAHRAVTKVCWENTKMSSLHILIYHFHSIIQGLLQQNGQYYTVVPRKDSDQAKRKRRSSFASSTPVPPGDSDESDGDSGHPLEDEEEDLHNRTHSSVSFFPCKHFTRDKWRQCLNSRCEIALPAKQGAPLSVVN